MFTVNEDLSIYATRGDAVILNVGADNNGVPYVFQPGDIVRMRIFEKKGCHCVVLLKDVVVSEATERVDISLTKDETKFGELISKPKEYWYEIELNPDNDPQTIVGYDDNGPKVFRLFPEGADVNGDDLPAVYDPAVDEALDAESPRPVQNKAIVAALTAIEANVEESIAAMDKRLTDNIGANDASVDELANSVNELGATVAEVSTSMANLSTDVIGLTDGVETLAGSVEEQSKQIEDVSSAVGKKQDELVSGQNIKTINGKSVLGDGNIDTSIPVDGALDANSQNPVQNKAVSAAVARIDNNISTLGSNMSIISSRVGTKQDTLVSGTNIKTVNGQSLLGEGDITIEGGSTVTVDTEMSETSENPLQNKVITAAFNQAAEVLEEMQKAIDAGGGGASITVDDAFNPESTNPVQNKVITAALGEAQTVMASMQAAITNIPTTVEAYVEQYISEALGGEY